MIAKCSCQHCKGQVQFDADELKSGSKKKCPHCDKDTALSVPPTEVQEMEKFISIEAIPAWFALVAGLIYATGFLIEFTFLNSIGIKESVTEVFKAKYIYVGLLCWQFPVCVALLLYGCARKKYKCKREQIERAELQKKGSLVISNEQKEQEDKEDSVTRVYWPTALLFTLLLLNFYLFIVFSQPGFFAARQGYVIFFFFFVFLALKYVRELEGRIEDFLKENPGSNSSSTNGNRTWKNRFRALLYITVILLMAFILIFKHIRRLEKKFNDLLKEKSELHRFLPRLGHKKEDWTWGLRIRKIL